MKKILLAATGMLTLGIMSIRAKAQISVIKDYTNKTSPLIGTFQGITYYEAGFSGMYAIPGTNGKEFWICSDRGVNIDCGNANPSGCTPTYDKLYAFPSYAPKIHRVKIQGDSVQVLRTITVKRPDGTGATGIINPTGLGSTSVEVPTTDTVLNCVNFGLKTVAKDTFGIDCEGIVADKDGNFWLCEEGGPTIWKLDQNGKLIKRFTPYANLPGAQAVDVAIDTVFKYRKNNRGFEGIALAPNGKIYAIIQSPVLYPNAATGEATRVHRILEIDPITNATRMFAYLNDGAIGSGSNQVRLKDWKIGDMAAINDSTFLVIEVGIRGTSDVRRMYKININGATNVHSGLYGGKTLEGLADSTGLATNSIVPVRKTLVMDLLANNWPVALDKCEGLSIINDSTIAICNDNDYGQTSASANGIATATGIQSHIITYSLKGADKLTGLRQTAATISQGITGISSSQAPYLVPVVQDAYFKSIMTTGDAVYGYKMCGTPDGIGAYDNGNGTFTAVFNHEFGNTSGIVRAHGSAGAFISKWIINKSDLSVMSGSDLVQRVYLWNPGTASYNTYFAGNSMPRGFSRFCSADLPVVSAFYNEATGLGTKERIFMNGEENGTEGRGFAHIITGPEAGTTYELPYLGKFSWENAIAHPATGDKTVVAGTDDATPGQVYFYVGTKQSTGNEIEKAGLNGGKLYGPVVSGMLNETNASIPAPGTAFTMADLGTVQNITGVTLQTNSNNLGVTQFLRPEDGAWDPNNPNDFYFATTNGFGSNSRLWKMHFNDLNNIPAGGTITAVLEGNEGQQMFDNLAMDNFGHILLVEDVGNNAHLGKVWQYDIATDVLKQVGVHDSTRFKSGAANYLTQDEEASGILDVQEILGPGMFLIDDQTHYNIGGELVEGGQLLAFFNPDTYNANPEISVYGNNNLINKGDMTPSSSDNTDMGNTALNTPVTKTFEIKNAGPASLIVSGLSITGANASEFTLVNTPTFPLSIAANASQTITVRFNPVVVGLRTATLTVSSNDFDEKKYDYTVQGVGLNVTKVGATELFSSAKLYPNPASDVATISMTMTKEQHVVVSVYDMQGREVLQAINKTLPAGEQQVTLNTSNLTDGVYFVQIASGAIATKMKMVIVH